MGSGGCGGSCLRYWRRCCTKTHSTKRVGVVVVVVVVLVVVVLVLVLVLVRAYFLKPRVSFIE